MDRRDFLKNTALTAGAIVTSDLLGGTSVSATENLPEVFYWEKCSSENLLNAMHMVQKTLPGKIAVKLHSGEPNGPNIIPPAWVKTLIDALPNSTAVECNVLYASPRKTTSEHRKALAINGWNTPIDILDADGDINFPITNGFHLKEIAVGKNLVNYDSLLILTHFKGHAMGGFGGSLKNIAIGCASGNLGKKQVHGVMEPGAVDKPYTEWPMGEYFMELMADSGKGIIDHFKNRYACINVMRRMSVDCDCAGVKALEPTAPDLGILASTDILAIDQASIDLVYALPPEDKKDLVERIESRKGLRQLSAMAELGMGNRKYKLVKM